MKERGTERGAQGRTRIDHFRQHEVRKSERAKLRTSFTFSSLNNGRQIGIQKWPSAEMAGKECPVFG